MDRYIFKIPQLSHYDADNDARYIDVFFENNLETKSKKQIPKYNDSKALFKKKKIALDPVSSSLVYCIHKMIQWIINILYDKVTVVVNKKLHHKKF